MAHSAAQQVRSRCSASAIARPAQSANHHRQPQRHNTNNDTQSWLGLLIMVLLVAYHYVTADPKFAEQQKQQQ